MRLGLAVVLLALCARLTTARTDAWHSDTTLWTAALRDDPTARAAVNLAAVDLRLNEFEHARALDVRAIALAATDRDPARVRRIVRQQLLWQDAFGSLVCGLPPWSAWC